MTSESPPPALCVCDDATFWPWLTWPDLGRGAGPDSLVLVPIAGFVDRPGLPLNAEEGVLLRVVRAASRLFDPRAALLVLPPLRFVAGPDGASAWAVDVPLAHAFIAEICRSVASSGFRRLVLCNASPWNEELCDVAARDLRLELGLQMVCVHLSALGLDFGDPSSNMRTQLAALLADAEPRLLAATGARLATLLGEISRRPPLREDGRLATMQVPGS